MSAPATHARARDPWFRLPRRTRKPAPEARTADLGDGFGEAFSAPPQAPAVRPLTPSPFEGASDAGLMDGPGLGDITLTDKPLHVLRPPKAPAPALSPEEAAARAGEETAAFTPGFAERAGRDRPYAPANGRDGEAPPCAYLVAVARDGSGGIIREPLAGLAASGGLRTGEDGHLVAGAWLGTGDETWFAFESGSAEAFDAAIDALTVSRDALVYGGFRVAAAAAGGGAP